MLKESLAQYSIFTIELIQLEWMEQFPLKSNQWALVYILIATIKCFIHATYNLLFSNVISKHTHETCLLNDMLLFLWQNQFYWQVCFALYKSHNVSFSFKKQRDNFWSLFFIFILFSFSFVKWKYFGKDAYFVSSFNMFSELVIYFTSITQRRN